MTKSSGADDVSCHHAALMLAGTSFICAPQRQPAKSMAGHIYTEPIDETDTEEKMYDHIFHSIF